MSAGDHSPILLKYDVTEADIRAFVHDSYSRLPQVTQAWEKFVGLRRAAAVIAVIVGLLAACLLVTDSVRQTLTGGFLLILAALAEFTLVSWLWQVWRLRRDAWLDHVVARVDLSGHCRYAVGPHVLSIGPDGLRLTGVHHETRQLWSGIAGVHDLAATVQIERGDGMVYFVPKRAIEPAAVTHLLHHGNEWLEIARGDRARLNAHLAQSDVPCPACNYNLRGLDRAACPECGLALNRQTLPAAFQS